MKIANIPPKDIENVHLMSTRKNVQNVVSNCFLWYNVFASERKLLDTKRRNGKGLNTMKKMNVYRHVSESAFHEFASKNPDKFRECGSDRNEVTHVIEYPLQGSVYVGGDYKCAKLETAVRHLLNAIKNDSRFWDISETITEVITPARNYGQKRVGEKFIKWMSYWMGYGYHVVINVTLLEEEGGDETETA